ncbi:MAG: ABC transporter permease [Planctomycetales bacterium]
MYLIENPVLQRELLVNLRMGRAFVMLFIYVAAVSGVVCMAWPEGQTISLTNPKEGPTLFNLFMIGQFVLISLMAPSFTAGSITGEKERKTYEMLLASPVKPGAVLLGKLLGSLVYLSTLIFASLPLVMMCLPLGGVHFSELIAAYLNLVLAAATFGMICMTCSCFFQRTAAALVVSYLIILVLALFGVWFWLGLGGQRTSFRLLLSFTLVPAMCVFAWIALYGFIHQRLLHPPDVGSEGKEVMDEEQELQTAVGMVIQRDQFPDMLFAPSRRGDLLPDGANPVFDKEMRNEIFASGTLMLRLVIQISMFLAIPLMGVFLFITPALAPWYISYVVVFNMLVGPVFAADAVTSERERQTLDLLLTTVLTPQAILWPKLLARLRVSTVLTMFLAPPIFLAGVMVSDFYGTNWLTLGLYLLIILMSCLTTCTLGMFCSVIFRRTATSQTVCYMAVATLFVAPVAVSYFAHQFYMDDPHLVETIDRLTFTSPFSAAFSAPLEIGGATSGPKWPVYTFFFLFYATFDLFLLGWMVWLFQRRWRVAQ